MNRNGFAPVAIVLVVAGLLIIGGFWYFGISRTTPSSITNPTQISTSTNPVTVSSNTFSSPVSKKMTTSTQGIYGTVSRHVYGCGQPSPNGTPCDMTGTNEIVGAGIQVSIDVADKIDIYGNVNQQHSIGTFYTDQNGSYRAILNPGKYLACIRGGQGIDANCNAMTTVQLGKFTKVDISIDTPRP